jgi:threonylcarbamoyladenosine tRNA methylthiotransferase MtaB
VVFGGDIIAASRPKPRTCSPARSIWSRNAGLTHLHVFPILARGRARPRRMPPLASDIVKDRARRLREKGEAALRRHLDAQVRSRARC